MIWLSIIVIVLLIVIASELSTINSNIRAIIEMFGEFRSEWLDSQDPESKLDADDYPVD